jgi:hypothetical protein
MYALIIGTSSTPCATLVDAVAALVAACEADAEVTTMPYIAQASGARLSDSDSDTVDQLMSA